MKPMSQIFFSGKVGRIKCDTLKIFFLGITLEYYKFLEFVPIINLKIQKIFDIEITFFIISDY